MCEATEVLSIAGRCCAQCAQGTLLVRSMYFSNITTPDLTGVRLSSPFYFSQIDILAIVSTLGFRRTRARWMSLFVPALLLIAAVETVAMPHLQGFASSHRCAECDRLQIMTGQP
jgi:hypothetical protein